MSYYRCIGLKNDSEPEVFPLKHHYKEMVR